MLKLDIAGIAVDIFHDGVGLSNSYQYFSRPVQREPDMTFLIRGRDHIDKPDGVSLLEQEVKWVRPFEGKNDVAAYMCSRDSDRVVSKIEVSENWRCIKASYLNGDDDGLSNITGPLSAILFNHYILLHQGIVIHASAIEHEGKGIVFSAPSETGKSTQANLWRKFMGARVLNGDRPAVRMVDGRPFVCGTPWSGSSPDFINARAPLSAIILLEQAQENTIRRLESSEAVRRLTPRCFLPYLEAHLMNCALDTLGKIIKSAPVYLLQCRPDREAVEMVYQCLR